MYKKITHHIVEEHFGHPAAAEIKYHVDNCPTGPMMGMASTISSMRLKMTLHRAFNDLVSGLRGHVVTHTTEEMAEIDKKLVADITAVSDVIKMYYGDTAATAFRSKLDAYIIDAVKAIEAAKIDPVSSEISDKLKASIDDLATFLGGVNPTVWPSAAVTSILTSGAEEFIKQVTSRSNKDYVSDSTSLEKVRSIFVYGAGNDSGFADVVAAGIMQQFPDLFR
jgi:hypothetical protein